MKWKKPEFSRNHVKKMGKRLAKAEGTAEELIHAVNVADNWRAAHAYPLQIVTSTIRRRLKDRDIIVVQRLKRLDSIIGKLQRKPQISLYDMQDLAGCRVIVPDITELYPVYRGYCGSRMRHAIHHTDDYVRNPQTSGYRGIHLILRYNGDKHVEYSGMFVEIQFRTQLQHLWSTAVETMGLYTGTNLKAGEGPENVLRFFSLISSAFAREELSSLVPGTPENLDDLLAEIKKENGTDDILGVLRAIRVATQEISRRGNNAAYYILILNFKTYRLRIKEYGRTELEVATEDYKQIESQGAEETIDAVLVSARSIDELKRAYPNYFSDIGEFVARVEKLLS